MCYSPNTLQKAWRQTELAPVGVIESRCGPLSLSMTRHTAAERGIALSGGPLEAMAEDKQQVPQRVTLPAPDNTMTSRYMIGNSYSLVLEDLRSELGAARGRK